MKKRLTGERPVPGSGTTRRELLKHAARLAVAVPLAGVFNPSLAALSAPDEATATKPQVQGVPGLTAADDALLQEIEERSFRYFWEAASPYTGLVKDRSQADGQDPRNVASSAATGFGLTAICIAVERGILKREEGRKRVLNTLRFLWERMSHYHGFFFHFMDLNDGSRSWECEISTIDTALLLCGVLTCRAYFDDKDIHTLATQLYDRADWKWMLNGGDTVSMGWKPEVGFLRGRWNKYSELMMIYLLGLGSSTHPLPASSWDAFSRPHFSYAGMTYIEGADPLFVHLYSQAWFDFRGKHDKYADYFRNSALATHAHHLFCLSLKDKYPKFSDDLWGFTASDSANGYVAWGGPPAQGPIDGTIVPAAAGGAVPFQPAECMRVLHNLRDHYTKKVWKRYSFVDAFNPNTSWVDPDVIGIDLGITMLGAENARTGFVWKTFMKNIEAQRGMERAGFRLTSG